MWKFLWVGIVILGPLLSAPLSLQKGQVIKQFFSYSIAESFQLNDLGLSTSLPCEPPRKFVEEPPVFHALATPWVKIFGPQYAYIFPLLVYIAFAWVLLWAARVFLPQHDPWMISSWVIAIPVFQRYSVQFIPDPLATLFLVVGATFLIQNRWRYAVSFFVLASTTKFLAAFAAIPLTAWYCFRRRWSLFRTASVLSIIALPFFVWVFALQYLRIPNPFGFASLLENRHAGSFQILLDGHYWLRVMHWTFVKGIGLPLTLLLVITHCLGGRFRLLIKTIWKDPIAIWCTLIVPYWILVRDGNFVHDYYALPFVVPFAWLALRSILSQEKITKFRYAIPTLWTISVVVGIASGVGMKPISITSSQLRPIYCDYEHSIKSIEPEKRIHNDSNH